MTKEIIDKESVDVVRDIASRELEMDTNSLQMAHDVFYTYLDGKFNEEDSNKIKKHMIDIRKLAHGRPVKYKVAEIFRDGFTDELEIVEWD